MVMCSRCHKRMAVVFITKLENGEKKNEGVCITCAKKLGLPLDNMLGDMMNKLGISSEDLAGMEDEVARMMDGEDGLPMPFDDDTDDDEATTPAIDLQKLFGSKEPDNAPNVEGGKASADHKKKEKSNKFLDTYCKNLNREAREGKLDSIVGRERELARVIQILSRRQKNNPCLIGEPGVGKTAIAEALAQKIVRGEVPYRLKNKELHLLDLTALVAGTQFRGQYESRLLGLLKEVKEAGNIILVIDEVHNIVGAGNSEGSVSTANMLKPALSRGEIQVIGATTLNEYRKYIEKDSALERRFQPVKVEEPSVEETLEMLKGIKHYYEEFHSIIIPDEILRSAVVLSERYITDRYLPDKAIDLLDEAAANLSLNSAFLNKSIEIRENLLDLKKQREALEAVPVDSPDNADAYEKIAKVKSKEMKLSLELKELERDSEPVVLSTNELADVVEVWTGVPALTVSANEYEQIDKLEERLKTHIIGQDKAVNAICRAIKRNRAGISYKRKPVSFIFAGPTGVGKTELVKQLANDLFHSPETLIRLDMSEFMEKHSVSKIIGAPPGYVGYDEAGQLTEKIRRRPYSVILFDEIEKAHPDVLNILLQILDDGRVTDAQGRTINFENTVLVMTTNAGSSNSSGRAGFGSSDSTSMEEARTMKALEGFLRPEFIN
ncbi:MAG: AAA family ATPase, partial [Eubacteriales bacterium]